MASELEEAKSKLADTEAQLQAMMSQPDNEDYYRRELEELRDTTGFDISDQQLREFNADPPSQGDTPGPGGDVGDMATQAQNPVGAMWMLWFQNDMKILEGPLGGQRIFNTTVFQPVMPIQLNDKWRVINRPVLTFNAFEVPAGFRLEPPNTFPGRPISPSDPFNTKWGLGDTMLAQYFYASHRENGFDPEWQFRMFFVPIIPSPDCAQRGLCGGGRSHGKRCRCHKCCR